MGLCRRVSSTYGIQEDGRWERRTPCAGASAKFSLTGLISDFNSASSSSSSFEALDMMFEVLL